MSRRWRSRTSCPGRLRRPVESSLAASPRYSCGSSTPWAMSGDCLSSARRTPTAFPSKPRPPVVIADPAEVSRTMSGSQALRRGDLAGDHDHAGGEQRFHAHPRVWVSASAASRMASEIGSATLSGCPSVTDSEVKWIRPSSVPDYPARAHRLVPAWLVQRPGWCVVRAARGGEFGRTVAAPATIAASFARATGPAAGAAGRSRD